MRMQAIFATAEWLIVWSDKCPCLGKNPGPQLHQRLVSGETELTYTPY